MSEPSQPPDSLDLGAALAGHCDDLLAAAPRLLAMRDAIESQNNLSASQAFQLHAAVLSFRPDLVIELGRAYGNSTAALHDAALAIGAHTVSVGFEGASGWSNRTAPRFLAHGVVDERWFDNLTILDQDIRTVDFVPYARDAKRVLVWWDAHGDDLAWFVLGALLPAIQGKVNVVAVHDIADSRHEGHDGAYVRTDGMPNFWQGYLVCPFEEIVPLFDFVSRNGIPFQTASASLDELCDRDPVAWSTLEERFACLPEPLPHRGGGWMWFSVPASGVVFPATSGEFPSERLAEAEARAATAEARAATAETQVATAEARAVEAEALTGLRGLWRILRRRLLGG